MSMELPAGTVVERYTLEAELGRGGMAVVYLVRHNQLGSRHAMKVLSAPTSSVKKRLVQEGRVQSSLQHPNVVAVTDIVDLDGTPALVMEYVRGPSLADFLRASRPTTAQIDELAQGILAGVDAAHRHGLVHRDLKPGNVLLSLASGRPVPKITDFGLAKMLDAERSAVQTRSGVVMGTPAYMAPEQIRESRDVDHRADVWSAGAILYELVTGRRAFEGSDTMELFMAICTGQRAPAVGGEPRMLEAIEAALTIDRDARVDDCATLLRLWRGEEQPDDAWAGVSLWTAQAPGAGEPAETAPSVAATPAPTADVDMAPLLPTHGSRSTVEIRGVPLDVAIVDPMTFAMTEGRVVTLTQRVEMAVEHLPRRLLEAFDLGAAPSFDDAADLCNALSEELRLTPAYAMGDWEPRKAWSIDDIGRMLYDVVKFDRVGPILAHFGEELPRVMQFEPERLGEVDGIGKRTAERIAARWDRTRHWTRPIALRPEATGFRLPTEAEVAAVRAEPVAWEWCWDRDGGPATMPTPETLPPGTFTDPLGAEAGPRRVVRRGAERGCREPWERAEDLTFRVVRRVP